MPISFLQTFFNKILKREEEEAGSKDVAKERLRLVLISDRANITPQVLENLKEDLIKTITKYIEVDVKGLEVFLEREETQVALTASMPVKKMKRTIGIQEK